jgi:hypothetical protein
MPGRFAQSAFSVPPENLRNLSEDYYPGPSQKALARFGSGLARSWSPQENGQEKG